MSQIQHISATLTCIALALEFLVGASIRAEDRVVRTDVFVSGTGGYHTYRIPAVIATPKGALLAFCEGRKTSGSDHGDVDLVLRRSLDHGASWTPMQIVYEEGGAAKTTIGNPCPVVDQDTGRVWLPFCRNNDDVLMTYSDDDGQTWSKPTEITDGVKESTWDWYATGPGVGIQMTRGKHPGRLVIPCDHSQQVDGQRVMFSHVFYSDDHGQTWKLGGTVDRHTDECQVVELPDGALMMNMRNYWGRDGKQQDKDKMRAVSISQDGGETWGELRFDGTLIEPICQGSLLQYSPTGDAANGQLLFSNPASKTNRQRLTVRLSNDEGSSWPAARLLHEGPSAYSCLKVLPDGLIGCLYEGGDKTAYEKIIFARFPLTSLAYEESVKVFILAGQSNMEGHGKVQAEAKANGGKGSLEWLVKNPDTAARFKHLVDSDGRWIARDDVQIWYLGRKGNLAPGFGFREGYIGPELSFGHVVGDAMKEPVLLIKLAWGGKSLAQDFRPPSSGGEVGPYYQELLKLTKDVMRDAKSLFPEYADRKLEVVGFGWHQGWNDRVNQGFNDQYEQNLANFIRDVRQDLGTPNLPFVIAETGMSGRDEKHPRALSLMKAQAAVARHDEFQGNVAFVGTRDYFRPQEASPSGQAYHWNSNAETYYLIGEGMGKAMLELILKSSKGGK